MHDKNPVTASQFDGNTQQELGGRGLGSKYGDPARQNRQELRRVSGDL